MALDARDAGYVAAGLDHMSADLLRAGYTDAAKMAANISAGLMTLSAPTAEDTD